MATAETDLGTPGARKGKQRRIVTPEGMALDIELASLGDRFGALLVDLLFLALAIGIFSLGVGIVLALFGAGGLALILIMLFFFVTRSFYFSFFELNWNGRTPGKRLLGLRVIDRKGGQLRADQIFARNLMREVEVYIPITAALMPGAATQGIDGWVTMALIAWVLALLLVPFFNRDNLRGGDLIASTWVISEPSAQLLTDVAGPAARQGDGQAGYRFTPAQLDAYGIYELQMLERLLRVEAQTSQVSIKAVYDKIRTKIGWQPAAGETPRAFLEAYYTALRAHLEKHMLFGEKRRDKHHAVRRSAK